MSIQSHKFVGKLLHDIRALWTVLAEGISLSREDNLDQNILIAVFGGTHVKLSQPVHPDISWTLDLCSSEVLVANHQSLFLSRVEGCHDLGKILERIVIEFVIE